MRKQVIAVSLILIFTLITGCTSTSSQPSIDDKQTSIPSISDVPSGNDTTPTPDVSQPTARLPVTDIDTSRIHGDIDNIYYANGSNVLILADSLYLYDISTGSVIAETVRESFYEESYFAIDNGIVVVGLKDSESSNNGGLMVTSDMGGAICAIYNNNLEKVNEISGSIFMDAEEFLFSSEHVTVSRDGTKIAYASDYGLFIYDIQSGAKTKLIDLLDDNAAHRSGLVMFDDVAFVNGDSMIAFKSQSLDVPAVNGKPSFDTYGTINIDGTELKANRNVEYAVKEMIAYDSLVFWAEDFTVPSGRLMVWEIASKNTKILSLSTKKESGTVFGSSDGQYFATSALSQDGLKDSLTVRVYDTNTGALVLEKTISDESAYMSREPEIRIIDGYNTCIVLLGNRQSDINTKVLTFNFD